MIIQIKYESIIKTSEITYNINKLTYSSQESQLKTKVFTCDNDNIIIIIIIW